MGGRRGGGLNRRPRTAAVGAHLSASDVARLVLRGEDVAPGLREQVLRAAERVQRAVLRRNRHDAGADPEHDEERPLPGDRTGQQVSPLPFFHPSIFLHYRGICLLLVCLLGPPGAANAARAENRWRRAHAVCL